MSKKVSNESNNDSSDMNAVMSKMQNLMSKMDDVDNMDDDEADNILQKMVGQANNVTKNVQAQYEAEFRDLTRREDK
jgi:hypothetical protein